MIYISCNWELLNRAEKMLYYYGDAVDRLAELKQQRKDMMGAFSTSIVVFICKSGTKPSSQPEIWLLKVSELNTEIDDIRRNRRKVQRAVSGLNYQDKQIIKMKYWQRQTRQEICDILNLPFRTYHRRLNNAIEKVARNLT